MLHHHITRRELFQVQIALFVAIALQLITRQIGSELLPGTQYVLIAVEVVLAFLMGFTANTIRPHTRRVHHAFAVVLLALMSVMNAAGLIYVLHSLVVDRGIISGTELLGSALAIFVTNIIVFALWYWEIDSPGLTRTRWSRHDKDFQFTQQDLPHEFPDWRPEFLDYLYLSITNAVNFAPADARPLTHQTKLLMAAQSMVSVFTLALVIARSVSILGS
jgi:uncharacterized membrane protein